MLLMVLFWVSMLLGLVFMFANQAFNIPYIALWVALALVGLKVFGFHLQ